MALRKKLKMLPAADCENNQDELPISKTINIKPNINSPATLEITSKYFVTSISQLFISLELNLNHQLKDLSFSSPVAAVYNPVEYAFGVHKMFVEKYLNGPKKILFVGMNPGPWGMCQTGVPFGSVPEVRDWIKISGTVSKPPDEIDCRPVTGFDCTRTEISGKRFWGLFKKLCDTPENFFRNAFVHNFCPLLFIRRSGKNITPAELKGEGKSLLFHICDYWLLKILKCLDVETVVGVGRFAQERIERALKDESKRTGIESSYKVVCLPHPSPRTVGNVNWDETATKRLKELDLIDIFLKRI